MQRSNIYVLVLCLFSFSSSSSSCFFFSLAPLQVGIDLGIPDNTQPPFWRIPMTGVSYGKQTLVNTEGNSVVALVDTGTSMIIGPKVCTTNPPLHEDISLPLLLFLFFSSVLSFLPGVLLIC